MKKERPYRAREEERSDGHARLPLTSSLALFCSALLCAVLYFTLLCLLLL